MKSMRWRAPQSKTNVHMYVNTCMEAEVLHKRRGRKTRLIYLAQSIYQSSFKLASAHTKAHVRRFTFSSSLMLIKRTVVILLLLSDLLSILLFTLGNTSWYTKQHIVMYFSQVLQRSLFKLKLIWENHFLNFKLENGHESKWNKLDSIKHKTKKPGG